MEANDLRIGNWIKSSYLNNSVNPETGFTKLDEDFMEVLFAIRNFEDLEPIPLTPEILEKAGFVKVTDEFQDNWVLNERCSVKLLDEPVYLYSNDESDAGCYVLTELRYLHQLQNIYHALTGGELLIEL
jgi:hypothetical protein